MAQKFHVDPSTKKAHKNGAISYASFAKVTNCPVQPVPGTSELRLTCYATGHPDTMSTVPACTRYKGQHIGGMLILSEWGVSFLVGVAYRDKMKALHAQGI